MDEYFKQCIYVILIFGFGFPIFIISLILGFPFDIYLFIDIVTIILICVTIIEDFLYWDLTWWNLGIVITLLGMVFVIGMYLWK